MDFNDALNSMIFTKLIKITTVNMLHQPSHVKQKKWRRRSSTRFANFIRARLLFGKRFVVTSIFV
jgi:sugar diacid utilization regulator